MPVSDLYNIVLAKTMMHHATTKVFSGRGCLKHRARILQLAQECEATSALDYGCGRGAQFTDVIGPNGETLEQLLGFTVAKYDPCVKEWRHLPERQFDFVWCVDVLEMIPADDIGLILGEIASKARKVVFITVSTFPAKKQFADGSNTHVTIEPAWWWEAAFKSVAAENPHLRVEWQIAG